MMADFDDGEYGLGLQNLTLESKKYIGHGGNNDGYS